MAWKRSFFFFSALPYFPRQYPTPVRFRMFSVIKCKASPDLPFLKQLEAVKTSKQICGKGRECKGSRLRQ